MRFIGNIAWLVLGGLVSFALYMFHGLLFCITIIGIPFGVQLMKLGCYSLWPFGRKMEFDNGEPGCLSIVGNVIWILMGWWNLALIHLVCGLIFCITIVGIPFGVKHFELAKTSLFPFGTSNRHK